jgi:hypothetical protein
MIAQADRPAGIAERTARLSRAELEALFLGVVAGLLDEHDRHAVEDVLRRREAGSSGRERRPGT